MTHPAEAGHHGSDRGGSPRVEDLKELLGLVAPHLDRAALVGWAQELVRIDTTNPPGNEVAAVDWLEERLRALGFTNLRRHEPAPGRVSLTGDWGGSESPTLIWNGHLDVVPAGDGASWRFPPFSAQLHDGRLWGRGTADMKGAFASLLAAIDALRRAGLRLQGRLHLQAVADEEMLGTLGTRYLVEHAGVRADAAICGEPTGLRPMIAARGLLWARITTFGRSSHASTPHLGVNAIASMSQVIQALENLPFTAHHPLLGGPTLNVATIQGGEKTNMVPDRCQITLDRRLVPGETAEGARRELEVVLTRLADEASVEARLEILEAAEPSEIPADAAIVHAVQAARAALELEPVEPAGFPGGTDARFLIHELGVPTVILGPGDLAQAHTTNESVAVAELEQGALLYAAVLAGFLGWEKE